MRIFGIEIVFFSGLIQCFAEDNYDSVMRDCTAQQTCTSCIRMPLCVWCPATGLNASMVIPIRCIPRKLHLEHMEKGNSWCYGHDVIDEEVLISVIKNKPLSSTKGREPVQVQPQNIRLKLRKNEELRINLKYTQAEDYPVDLYYLMDLSASMEPYRQHLSELGQELASTMRSLTSKFKLGFGSFVDKVILPMTDTSPSKLASPCDGCASPYGYKHQMSLNDNDALFTYRVRKAPISGNLDAPEGGMDAMMQAMVCTKQIGWNDKARHLLVMSTDASSHLAGDGRIAGIIDPNDSECHLDASGTYTHSLLQDYPSVSQINRQARDHNIHVIFAVPATRNETYQMLSKRISDSAVGLIEKHDRSAVIQLIRDEYMKLVSSVILIDSAPNFIDVKYSSSCLNASGEKRKETNTCDGLHYGDIVEFEIVITATQCPVDRNLWKGSFFIRPQGLNENLAIDYEIICECPCDRPGSKGHTVESTQCNHHGTLICGVCSCDPGFNGDNCACRGNDDIASRPPDDCRSPNDTSDCSGHGTCKCGVCECQPRKSPNEKYYRKYCECNNFSCQRITDGSRHLLCNDNGECECGVCKCRPGWSGEACECRDNACLPPGKNAEICSGHGDCKCGQCICNPPSIYSGDFCQNAYCEDPKSCAGTDCDKLKDCVECKAYTTGPSARDGCDGCYNQVTIVDRVEMSSEEYGNGTRMCLVPSDDGCTFVFKYKPLRPGGDQQLYNITVERTKKCPEPVAVLGVAIGVIVGTVMLGLLGLLIWKLLTTLHDRKEFAKFEKERAMAKWGRDVNPLYKPSTTTFNNPTFSQSKQD